MIIEDETKSPMCRISIDFKPEPMITQGHDTIIIDKYQVVQLIAALQRWVDGGEIE